MHPILSGTVPERVNQGCVKTIYVSNSCSLPDWCLAIDKIKVFDISATLITYLEPELKGMYGYIWNTHNALCSYNGAQSNKKL